MLNNFLNSGMDLFFINDAIFAHVNSTKGLMSMKLAASNKSYTWGSRSMFTKSAYHLSVTSSRLVDLSGFSISGGLFTLMYQQNSITFSNVTLATVGSGMASSMFPSSIIPLTITDLEAYTVSHVTTSPSLVTNYTEGIL